MTLSLLPLQDEQIKDADMNSAYPLCCYSSEMVMFKRKPEPGLLQAIMAANVVFLRRTLSLANLSLSF